MSPSKKTPKAHPAFSTVTIGALKQRIRRKLRHEGEVLRTTRSERWFNELGEYFIVNQNNWMVAQHVDLEVLGREIGVVKDWERVCATCDYTVG